jgi:hypothetical protein
MKSLPWSVRIDNAALLTIAITRWEAVAAQ